MATTTALRNLGAEDPAVEGHRQQQVIPADLKHGAPRVAFRDLQEVEQSWTQDVDLIEGKRLHVALKAVKYQQALKRYYDKNVKPGYNVGDLVLKRKTSSAGQSKMSALWEGPYIVTEVLGKATFKLAEPEARELSNTWNSEHLRRFYP